MQGLESLDKFKGFVSQLGGLGRYEDTYMVHAAEGETVVPMEVLDSNPVLKERLFETMRDMGIQPERYIVGNEFNSINPLTGQPEFFLKALGRRLRKAKQDIGRRLRKGAADISGYVAPIVGAMYGPAAGAAAGALLGQYKRENPGDPNQALQMALRGGISGLGANLASGQGLTLGGGLKGAYGLDTFNPLEIGKAVLNMPAGTGVTRTGTGLDAFLNEGATGLDRFKFMDSLGFGSGGSDIGMMSTPGGGTGFDANTILKFGGDTSKTIGQNAPLIERLFGKDTLTKLLIKFGVSKVLGDAIKEENQQAQKDMENQMANYGKQSNFGVYDALINPGELVQAPDTALTDVFATAADGGILDLDAGGELKGPGTGTSDSIPAMLSDGEFVMTAKAVRGAGGGDRREGARKMYEAMDKLEAQA
jgi:hypothetical protein